MSLSKTCIPRQLSTQIKSLEVQYNPEKMSFLRKTEKKKNDQKLRKWKMKVENKN